MGVIKAKKLCNALSGTQKVTSLKTTVFIGTAVGNSKPHPQICFAIKYKVS